MAAAAAAAATIVASYTCVKKSQARVAFPMDSDKTAIITVGTRVDAIERQVNENGVVRIKFGQGWVSEKTGAGALCFQLVSEIAPLPASTPVAAGDVTAFKCVKKSEPAEAAAAPAAEPAARPAAEPVAAAAPEAVAAEPSPEPAVVVSVPSAAKAAAEPAVAAAGSYKCVKKSQARVGFDMGSDKASVIAVGTVVTVLEACRNDAGILRINFDGGWVSEHASNGAVCFEPVVPPGQLGAPPVGLAPVPAPGPEPEPEPEVPLVITVTEDELFPGEHKCLKKSQVREGPEMESTKAGVLDEVRAINRFGRHFSGFARYTLDYIVIIVLATQC
jgi:ribonuclease E